LIGRAGGVVAERGEVLCFALSLPSGGHAVTRSIERVLVVDDEWEVLEAARAHLVDFEVLVERDPRRVQGRVDRDHPDTVILDQWLLDDVKGHELANELKELQPDLLVILWSGALDVHALRFLQKRCRADLIAPKTSFKEVLDELLGAADICEPDWNAVSTLNEARRQCARASQSREAAVTRARQLVASVLTARR